MQKHNNACCRWHRMVKRECKGVACREPVLEKLVRTSTDEELEMIRTQAEGHARGRL